MKAAAYLLMGAVALPVPVHCLANDWKQATVADAVPYIDRANQDWTRAIVAGDADVMSAPYDADGIFIRPDGSTIRGKAKVRQMYAKRPSDVKVLKASI